MVVDEKGAGRGDGEVANGKMEKWKNGKGKEGTGQWKGAEGKEGNGQGWS